MQNHGEKNPSSGMGSQYFWKTFKRITFFFFLHYFVYYIILKTRIMFSKIVKLLTKTEKRGHSYKCI